MQQKFMLVVVCPIRVASSSSLPDERTRRCLRFDRLHQPWCFAEEVFGFNPILQGSYPMARQTASLDVSTLQRRGNRLFRVLLQLLQRQPGVDDHFCNVLAETRELFKYSSVRIGHA